MNTGETKSASPRPTAPASSWGLLLSLVVFVVGLLVVLPLYAWVGWHRHGQAGLMTALVAAAVCGVGGASALICGVLLQKSSPVGGVLGGALFRFGFPLVAAVVISENVPYLARAGQFGMIVAFYLYALLIETLLAVRLVRPANLSAAKVT